MKTCSSAFGRRGRRAASHGMTLVEVLIVMVILVFGILSVIRVFPGGFAAIRSAENSASAVRLGSNLLESLKQSGGSLPEAVYSQYVVNDPSAPYAQDFDPSIAPDNFGPYKMPDPNVKNPGLYSDCDKARYISNETVHVTASPYLPNFAPIVIANATTLGNYDNPYLKVISRTWTIKVGDSTPASPPNPSPVDMPIQELHSGSEEFLIDYKSGKIAVPVAAYDQLITFGVAKGGVSYILHLRIPATVTNPATKAYVSGYSGDWFSPSNAVLGYEQAPLSGLPLNNWDADTAGMIRPFQYLAGTTPAFSADPYEYGLVNDNITGTVANLGSIKFNPLASGQNGGPVLTARISYSTLDWHVIHEDREVRATGDDSMIALTLRNLKKVGDVQNDSAVYNGLFDIVDTPTFANKKDLVVVDRDTGRPAEISGVPVQIFDLDEATPPFQSNAIYVSYTTGHLRVPDAVANAAKRLRIFYSAKSDWAVAIQKSPLTYVHSVSGTAEDYNGMTNPSLVVNRYAFGSPAAGLTNLLFFPVADAGKQVRIDRLTYTTSATPGPVKDVTVTQVLVKVSLDKLPSQPNILLPYVDLTKVEGVTNMDTNTIPKITSIRGVSVKAVMIWHEHDKWKTRSIDTLMVQ